MSATTPFLAGGDPPEGAAIATPSGFYVTGEDALRVTSWNSAAGVALSVEGRLLDFRGRAGAFAERHVPNTDRTAASSLFRLGEGWLQNVQLRASAGTPRRGQCFVLLELVRGLTGAVIPLATLAQGYVTDTQRRSWPGSPFELSTEGPGVVRSITGSDPAAGAEFTETVPANTRWRVISLLVSLVTSATVASRLPLFYVDDGATTVFVAAPSATQAASSTVSYLLSGIGVHGSLGGVMGVSLPLDDFYLSAGYRLGATTFSLQVGDNYGAPQLHVEEWIED